MKTLQLLICVLLASSYCYSFCGRIDGGPVYLHVDILHNEKALKKVDMVGGRADATLLPVDGLGFCVKPFGFVAGGGATFLSYGVGLGHYTPLNYFTSYLDKFSLVPVIGISFSRLETTMDIVHPLAGNITVEEVFHSTSYYAGGELTYCLTPGVSLTGIFQYTWSNTKTSIANTISRGKSSGLNFAGVIDAKIIDRLWATLALGYNNSMSHEKDGIRGWGGKLGLAYYF